MRKVAALFQTDTLFLTHLVLQELMMIDGICYIAVQFTIWVRVDTSSSPEADDGRRPLPYLSLLHAVQGEVCVREPQERVYVPVS